MLIDSYVLVFVEHGKHMLIFILNNGDKCKFHVDVVYIG